MITALWIIGIIFLYLVIGIIVAVLCALYNPSYDSTMAEIATLLWPFWGIMLFMSCMGDLVIWIRNKVVEKREKKK